MKEEKKPVRKSVRIWGLILLLCSYVFLCGFLFNWSTSETQATTQAQTTEAEAEETMAGSYTITSVKAFGIKLSDARVRAMFGVDDIGDVVILLNEDGSGTLSYPSTEGEMVTRFTWKDNKAASELVITMEDTEYTPTYSGKTVTLKTNGMTITMQKK